MKNHSGTIYYGALSMSNSGPYYGRVYRYDSFGISQEEIFRTPKSYPIREKAIDAAVDYVEENELDATME